MTSVSPSLASLQGRRRSTVLLAVDGITALLRFAANAWRARRNRRAVANLLGFDDHLLADIGVTRADVASSIASSDWGDPSSHLTSLREERRSARPRTR